MEQVGILVYRDTIEEHDDIDNLAEIFVTKKFAQRYFNECGKDVYWDSLEEFLNDYTADCTEDFYEYAWRHNAIIEIKRY